MSDKVHNHACVERTLVNMHRFDLNDVRQLAAQRGFETTYDESIGSVTIFEARNGDVSRVCTRTDKTKITVTARKTFMDADYAEYRRASVLAAELRDRLHARTEGFVHVLREPGRSRLGDGEAVLLLSGPGKRIRMSVTCGFDNIWNDIDEIDCAVQELGKVCIAH